MPDGIKRLKEKYYEPMIFEGDREVPGRYYYCDDLRSYARPEIVTENFAGYSDPNEGSSS